MESILLDQEVTGAVDWPRMHNYLNHHGLMARSYRMYHEGKFETVPDETLAEFKRQAMVQIYRNQQYFKSLKTLSDHFAKHNIEWQLIKGASVAQNYYKNPQDRDSSDLDILISRHYEDEISSVMGEIGFTEGIEIKLKDNAHKKLFLHPQNQFLPVEIHLGLGHYPVNGEESLKLSQNIELNYQGEIFQVNVMPPEIEIKYLIHHACVQHRMSHLKWFVDFFEMDRKSRGTFAEKRKISPGQDFIARTLLELNNKSLKTNLVQSFIWKLILSDRTQGVYWRVPILRSYFTSPLAFLLYRMRLFFARSKRNVS